MIRKIADEDPDEANDKDKKGIAVINFRFLLVFGLFFYFLRLKMCYSVCL